MIYLQSECIRKYHQFEIYKEHDFDVILKSVVPCRKLRWIRREHSNDVARKVEISGKSTIMSHDNRILSRNITFTSHQRLH